MNTNKTNIPPLQQADFSNLFPQLQAAPIEAFQTWTGAMAYWGRLTQQNMAAAALIRNEWYQFIQHRMEQDIAFASKLCACKTPEEYWATNAQFFQQTTDDYRKELTEVSRICTSVVTENTDALQDATRKAARERWCAAPEMRH